MARLLLESAGERREIVVSGSITVGRERTASLWLDDKTLSREHTKFYVEGGKLFVRDLDSKNGTFLNGVQIRNTQTLKPGDRVKVGLATFTMLAEAGAMPAVQAPVAQAPRPAPPTPAHARASVTATAPATPRPRLGGPHPAAAFLYRIILLGVFVVVTYLSKGFFVSLLR